MLSRETAWQALRYGVGGGVLALIYSLIYATLAVRFEVAPLMANTIAFLVNLVAGWLIHSRWSFRTIDRSVAPATVWTRFLVVNLLGYGLNSIWVWLFIDRLGTSVILSTIPIVVVTPAFSFMLNRVWIFNRNL